MEDAGTPIVLVVDDEPGVRAAMGRTLESGGYEVRLAADADEALRILQAEPVHVLISDQHMPGMSGIDLLKIVRVRHPRVVRILLTADKDPETPVRSINESEVYRFVRKPWNDSDLRTIMHFAFEVIRLERDKRRLLALIRDERAAPLLQGSAEDPVGIERELEALAADEMRGR